MEKYYLGRRDLLDKRNRSTFDQYMRRGMCYLIVDTSKIHLVDRYLLLMEYNMMNDLFRHMVPRGSLLVSSHQDSNIA